MRLDIKLIRSTSNQTRPSTQTNSINLKSINSRRVLGQPANLERGSGQLDNFIAAPLDAVSATTRNPTATTVQQQELAIKRRKWLNQIIGNDDGQWRAVRLTACHQHAPPPTDSRRLPLTPDAVGSQCHAAARPCAFPTIALLYLASIFPRLFIMFLSIF